MALISAFGRSDAVCLSTFSNKLWVLVGAFRLRSKERLNEKVLLRVLVAAWRAEKALTSSLSQKMSSSFDTLSEMYCNPYNISEPALVTWCISGWRRSGGTLIRCPITSTGSS